MPVAYFPLLLGDNKDTAIIDSSVLFSLTVTCTVILVYSFTNLGSIVTSILQLRDDVWEETRNYSRNMRGGGGPSNVMEKNITSTILNSHNPIKQLSLSMRTFSI